MDEWGASFFFFKQKTAYEMLRSLVGSEMCIRDRLSGHEIQVLLAMAMAEGVEAAINAFPDSSAEKIRTLCQHIAIPDVSKPVESRRKATSLLRAGVDTPTTRPAKR
eukprot:TRINITY_DN24454_c0_g1_i1.p1 TRINITY_DN24454_c0_g1~~TRINITY_DN24454_c0_g1_i1.p1  ORF type:complete len:107 (-),score=35.37 TRINITY_DN24454_c0_g1_i1:52-372(-)